MPPGLPQALSHLLELSTARHLPVPLPMAPAARFLRAFSRMISSAVRGRVALVGLQAGRCSAVQNDGVMFHALLSCERDRQGCSR